MSKNTLFNYFTRSPASAASKTTSGSSNNDVSKTPKRPLKDDSVTPKRTPKSNNGTAKKDKIANGSSKKPTDKRKQLQHGNILLT